MFLHCIYRPFLKTMKQLHNFLPPYVIKASNWFESQRLSNNPQIYFIFSYKYKVFKTGHWVFEYKP